MRIVPSANIAGRKLRNYSAKFALPALSAILAFTIFRPFASLGIDPHHDGVMLKPALDLLSGQTLFRETFSQYGAVSTFLQAGFLGVFGASLLNLKLFTVSMYALSSGALVYLWRNILPWPLALASMLAWLLFAPFFHADWLMLPWSSVPAIFFQALAILFLFRAVQNRQKLTYALLSGISCGLVILCRQPVGGFTLISMTAAWFWISIQKGCRKDAKRNLGATYFGFGATLTIFLLYLLLTQSLPDWFYQNIVWPASWVNSIKFQDKHVLLRAFLMPAFNPNEWYILGLLLILLVRGELASQWVSRRGPKALTQAFCLALAAGLLYMSSDFLRSTDHYWLWLSCLRFSAWACALYFVVVAPLFSLRLKGFVFNEANRTTSYLIVSLSFLCLSSWMQIYPVLCPRHSFWALTPAMGLFIWLLHRSTGQRQWVTFAIAACLLSTFAHTKTSFAIRNLQTARVELGRPSVLKGMKVLPTEAKSWNALAETLASYSLTRSNFPIILYGPDALYATMAPDLKNATPFYVRWEGLPHIDDSEQLQTFIEREQPLIFAQSVISAALKQALDQNHYVLLSKLERGSLYIPDPALKTRH